MKTLEEDLEEIKATELNKWIEENKEMVDLVLQDFQKFQKKLYGEMYIKASKKLNVELTEKNKKLFRELAQESGVNLDNEYMNVFVENSLEKELDRIKGGNQ